MITFLRETVGADTPFERAAATLIEVAADLTAGSAARRPPAGQHGHPRPGRLARLARALSAAHVRQARPSGEVRKPAPVSPHRRSALRASVILTVAAATTLVGAAPAFADVIAQPGEGMQGDYAVVALRVSTESDTAGTVKLQVTLPTALPLSSVRTTPRPGWTATMTKFPLNPPIEQRGRTITEAVSSVTWTADPEPGSAPASSPTFRSRSARCPSTPASWSSRRCRPTTTARSWRGTSRPRPTGRSRSTRACRHSHPEHRGWAWRGTGCSGRADPAAAGASARGGRSTGRRPRSGTLGEPRRLRPVPQGMPFAYRAEADPDPDPDPEPEPEPGSRPEPQTQDRTQTRDRTPDPGPNPNPGPDSGPNPNG